MAITGNKAVAAGAFTANGGAIYNNGTTFITGGSISNNTAQNTGATLGNGGGIYNLGTAAISTTISNNIATIGGGVYNAGQATFTNGSISTNAANSSGATSTTQGWGGGIYNTGTASVLGNSVINGTTITNNTAKDGAGIMNLSTLAGGAKVAMTGGSVTNNITTAVSGITNTGFGGGIYSFTFVGSPALSLSGVDVSGNKALLAGAQIGTGGGIYSGASAVISNSTITNNTATSGGGLFSAAAATINNTTSFTGNTATSGAGVYNTNTATISDTSITNNTAPLLGTTAGNGGGLYNTGTANITNGTITGNVANPAGSVGSIGGGIYSTGTTTFTGTLSNNSATAGGGIYNSGTSTFTNSSVNNNQAPAAGTTAGAGGGIYNTGTNSVVGTATLTGTTVNGNTANYGAGVLNLSFLAAGSKVTVSGGQIRNNTATAVAGNAFSGFGGGAANFALGSPGLSLSGVDVSGNRAIAAGTISGLGGGVYNGITATITNGSTITENSATSGGGVYNAGTVTISDASIKRNDAILGGGVYNTGTATVAGLATITDTAIDNNTSNDGGGIINLGLAAGSKVSVTRGSISNNTTTALAGNTASGFGGGVYNKSIGSPSLSLTDVDVAGNKAVAVGTIPGNGGGVYSANAATVDGTTISGNQASNGGGVYNTGPLTLTSAEITSNGAVPASGVSSGVGGGLYNLGNNNQTTNTANVAATDTPITKNTGSNGAGVFNSGGLVSTTDGEISDNTVTAIAGQAATGFGGGVYSISGLQPGLVLSGTKVERNKAETGGSGSSAVLGNGGGILNFSFAQITSPSFKDNTATGSGGAIYNYAGTVDVTTTPFTGNYAAFLGGTIYDAAATAGGVPSTTLVDSPIAGTGTLTFVGGGVAVGPSAWLDVTGGSITGSKAVSAGGLYVQEGGKATLDHTPVTGNTADGGVGGGIANAGKTTVTDSEISGNTAIPNPGSPSNTGLGGGVYNASASAPADPRLSLNRVTLAENTSNAGSAIYSTAPVSLLTSTVTENTASPSFGAIVSAAKLTLVNDTINRNTGGSSAGGLAQFGSTPADIAGTVIAENGTTNCFGPINDGGRNSTDNASCAFTNNSVIGDPKLNALADNTGPTRTELPKNNSPLINKIPLDTAAGFNDAISGDPVVLCPTAGSVDQRGIARPQGPRCDIGAVELSGLIAPTLNGPDHALFITGTPNSVGFTYTGIPQPTLTLTGDALPNGVTFTDNDDGTATLGGTAAAGTAGTYHFTITASNGETPDAKIDFTLVVIEPLVITTTTLPEGTPGVPYNATLAATGGTHPYAWSVSAGSLPPGLSLNPTTGAITGTPTTRGLYTFTAKVTDATDPQQVATKQLSILVRSNTALKAEPAVVKIALPLLRITIVRLEARLTELPANGPLSGQLITFKAGQKVVCTATTDANGVARCNNVTTVGVELPVLLALGYDAYFDGTQTLRPSQAHGPLIGS